MIFGGSRPPATAKAEAYDGTSWTEVADLAVLDDNMAGTAANTTSALTIGGGYPPQALKASEEWADPSYSVKTVTTS